MTRKNATDKKKALTSTSCSLTSVLPLDTLTVGILGHKRIDGGTTAWAGAPNARTAGQTSRAIGLQRTIPFRTIWCTGVLCPRKRRQTWVKFQFLQYARLKQERWVEETDIPLRGRQFFFPTPTQFPPNWTHSSQLRILDNRSISERVLFGQPPSMQELEQELLHQPQLATVDVHDEQEENCSQVPERARRERERERGRRLSQQRLVPWI